MAQHDFGGSCTAQRYCHSEARISGHVAAEQGGVSLKKAMTKALTSMTSKRQISYNHNERSTPSGGVAMSRAVS